MEGMVLSFQVGIIEVKAVDYQTQCLTHPQKMMTLLEDVLPKLATSRCDQLGTEIKVIYRKLLILMLEPLKIIFNRSVGNKFDEIL